MRFKNEKILGIPIPEKPISREEFENLTEDDLRAMGVETRFWDWYLGVCWELFKAVALLMSVLTVFHVCKSYLSGDEYEFIEDVYLYFKLLGVSFLSPIILVVVSQIWWHGGILIKKIRGSSGGH